VYIGVIILESNTLAALSCRNIWKRSCAERPEKCRFIFCTYCFQLVALHKTRIISKLFFLKCSFAAAPNKPYLGLQNTAPGSNRSKIYSFQWNNLDHVTIAQWCSSFRYRLFHDSLRLRRGLHSGPLQCISWLYFMWRGIDFNYELRSYDCSDFEKEVLRFIYKLVKQRLESWNHNMYCNYIDPSQRRWLVYESVSQMGSLVPRGIRQGVRKGARIFKRL